MNIRKARINDIENNLLNLYIEGYTYHYNGKPNVFLAKKETELKEELIITINNSNILILENEEKILGYLLYQIKEKHNKILWIDELVIDENNRQLGNGKKLLEKVKEIAKKEKCQRIELCCWSFNQNALAVYKHIGYKEQRVILEMEL